MPLFGYCHSAVDDSPLIFPYLKAVIDHDNALIEKLLLGGQVEEAQQVFEKGAFSRSYAELTFGLEGLPGDVKAHSSVKGAADSGEVIMGMMLDHGKLGDKVVRVLYENADNLGFCNVGGNPEPITSGCKSLVDASMMLALFCSFSHVCPSLDRTGFAASGEMTFDLSKTPVPYTYNLQSGNKNDRTLALFSTSAKDKMRPCPKCEFYTDYFRFYLFFGATDYANRWILSALTGTRTVFDSSTADFQNVSIEARSGMS